MVNYKAIADAVETGAYPDYQAAYDAMSVELGAVTYRVLTGSELRKWAAVYNTDYQSLKTAAASGGAEEIAVLLVQQPDSTLDVGDPTIQAILSALPISELSRDAIYSAAQEQQPKWPSLKAGHVQNAMQKRAEGVI